MTSGIHISLAAEPLFHVWGVPVNNSLITGIVGSITIMALFIWGAKKVTMNPKSKFANTIETICEMIIDLIEQVMQDRAKSRRYFPFLMTIFIFIVVNNWLGLLPGVGSITVQTAEGVAPLFRGANADLNTTLALAMISVIMTQIYAAKELGVVKHLKKYFSLNPIMTFVGVLELVGEFSKMISFSFRLFGNIFAGEVLLAVIAFLMPIVAPLPFFGLELFVGLVQGLVFTMLTLVFLAIATSDHSEYNHGEASGTHGHA